MRGTRPNSLLHSTVNNVESQHSRAYLGKVGIAPRVNKRCKWPSSIWRRILPSKTRRSVCGAWKGHQRSINSISFWTFELIFWPKSYKTKTSSSNCSRDENLIWVERKTASLLCLWLWKQNTFTTVSAKMLLGLSNLISQKQHLSSNNTLFLVFLLYNNFAIHSITYKNNLCITTIMIFHIRKVPSCPATQI